MIKRNIGNHAHSRIDHIRSIEPALPSQLQAPQGRLSPAQNARMQSQSSSRKSWDATATPRSTSLSATRSTSPCRAAKSSSLISSPLIRMRSLIRTRCGEVYKPIFNPEARRIEASVAAVDPLPFVPAISTLGNAAPDDPAHPKAPACVQVEFVRRRLRQLVPEGKHARHCGFVGHKEALSYKPSAFSPEHSCYPERSEGSWCLQAAATAVNAGKNQDPSLCSG